MQYSGLMRLTVKSIAAIATGSLAFLGTLGGAIAFYDDYRPWPTREHLRLVADRHFSHILKDARAWKLELELELARCEKDRECTPENKAILRNALQDASNEIEEIKAEREEIK